MPTVVNANGSMSTPISVGLIQDDEGNEMHELAKFHGITKAVIF
jgi:hypothetical protein